MPWIFKTKFEPAARAVIFFRNSTSISLRTSFFIFSTSGRDDWRVSFARTASLSTLYCENSAINNWNSPSDIWLSVKALESRRSTVSRFAMARVTISWCFFIFESSFLLAIIRPEEAAANAPLTPPSGTAAAADKADARLADESKVETHHSRQRSSWPPLWPVYIFLRRPDNGQLLRSEKPKLHLLFAFWSRAVEAQDKYLIQVQTEWHLRSWYK